MSQTITTDARASFDLTDFPSPEAFRTVLEQCGLSEDGPVPEQFEDWDGWVWSNDDVAVHTYANPLTGERAGMPDRTPEPGYASYVHLIGESDAVDDVFRTVEKYASYIKQPFPSTWGV